MEQRLAARFDPEAMRDREIAFEEGQRPLKKQNGLFVPVDESEPAVHIYRNYVIDGCRNPELFLPTELFDLYLLHPPKSDPYAERLRPIVARYLAARKAGAPADEVCRLRALSLSMARGEIGAETFDRFLYQTMAPNAVIFFPTSDDAARLADREHGCRHH